MSEQGFTEYRQVEAYYTSRLTDIVEELGAKVVVWQDPIDNNVTVSNLVVSGESIQLLHFFSISK